ncbi:two-component sensor histidine kinase [Nocardiopsis sp. TSRI0078]|uniref:sensor histidine kinase n=1 Tax=unclassified Nocardiopsis TaxID=2649073 RepID=UPI00093ECA8D|nr:histidine kinase [Nocardiopsis sp. TSRI0078]OKI13733.1 two-component sensor histidine kinase [Nocardiopsis sp. TSRI0078]
MRERLRRWIRPATEAALWTLLGLVMVAELSGPPDRPPFLEMCVLLLALGVAAALRRSLPLTAVGVMLTGATLQTSASVLLLVPNSVISPWLAVMALSFLAGTRSERVRPMVATVAVACGFTFVLYLLSGIVLGSDTRTFLSDSVDWMGGALAITLSTFAPWLFGRYQRLYRRVARGGWEIAERMERSRAAEADRARLRERARIASRMHDSLGHDLALIAVRAAALEMTAQEDPERRRAAGELRTAAHEANLRLREVIGVLREGGEDPGDGDGAGGGDAPEPVASLVQRASDAGMPVRLLREGPDPDPATPGGGVVYRVVQEALTNAAKYAPGAEVTVRVVREADRTRVSVSDTGSAAEALLPARRREGSGLAGLRSLVEESGGGLDAGPQDGAGFTVRATVPDSGVGRADGGAEDGAGAWETRRAHSEAREGARRRLVAAVTVPAALGLGTVLAGLGLLAWVGVNTVLPPERYGRLSVGDDREQVERVLPRFDYPERSVPGRPPEPPGARCSFYLVRYENGLPPVYRLCFADGVLVSKDEIQRFE